jgi:HPt (histidine-containing phosphotransfer) domain-containing protein
LEVYPVTGAVETQTTGLSVNVVNVSFTMFHEHEMGSIVVISMESAESLAPGRPIDLVHLSRQSCGDRDLEREVLGLFREQCARLLAVIAEAGRAKAGLVAAHTLKGAARGVGAFRVASLAERFEAGPSGAAGFSELTEAVAEARAAIAQLLGEA